MQYDNDSVYRVYLTMPDTYEVEVHGCNPILRTPKAEQIRYMGRDNLPLWLQEKIAMLDLVSPTGLLTGIGTVHTSANSDRVYWIGSQDASDVAWGRSAPLGARYVEDKQDGRYYLQQLDRSWYTIDTTVSSHTLLGIDPFIITANSHASGRMTRGIPQNWARDGKFAGLEQSQQAKKAKQKVMDRKYDDYCKVVNAMLRAYDSCKAALTKDSK